jgi:hypothetical protein
MHRCSGMADAIAGFASIGSLQFRVKHTPILAGDHYLALPWVAVQAYNYLIATWKGKTCWVCWGR